MSRVSTPRDGFLVIQAPIGEAAGEPIGYSPVSAGDSNDVSVKLEREVAPGTKLLAVLHEDTGEKGSFEYSPVEPAIDPPLQQGERPLMVAFTVRPPLN